MSELDRRLAELALLDRPALAARWQSSFGVPAPKGCQSPLLRAALAWHLQRQASPEWSGSSGMGRLVRSLRQPMRSTALAPGTSLRREWQGRTHLVTVLQSGFVYGGTTYRSLSAIARLITGTRWSGPAFFGLNS